MIDQIFFTGTYLHIKQFLTSIPKQQVFAIRAPNWIKFITSTALGKLLGFLRPVLLLNIHLIFSCTVRDKTHPLPVGTPFHIDRKSTRLNSSHVKISYAVFCLKKK